MLTETLKETLFEKINQLPEMYVHDVINFVDHLMPKKFAESAHKSKDELNPNDDPILMSTGIADTEPFSHRIDEELYGIQQ